MLQTSHPVGESVAVVHANHAATEERLQGVQHLRVAPVLHDGEFRKHLIASLHVVMRIDPDVKAALTVDEASHPARFEIHRTAPNIKSLRVLETFCVISSLPCGLSPCRADFDCRPRRADEYRCVFEDFPAYGTV